MLTNLDTGCTLKKRSTLSRKAESPTARLGRRRVWATFMLIAFISCFSKDYSVAKENYKPTHYKQYILITLNDLDETYCLVELYHNESRFNPKARNGSHYGIPQGRSEWLRDQDGYTQVRWGLSYIQHRYSTPCNAYEHWKINNWH